MPRAKFDLKSFALYFVEIAITCAVLQHKYPRIKEQCSAPSRELKAETKKPRLEQYQLTFRQIWFD